MSKKVVYQTLEDRDTDLDQLELNGPYLCNWENSWLGDGYYFWDTFIDNAHWWGNEVRKYRNGYIICQALCDFDTIKCLDLVGNTEQLLMLRNSYELLKNNGIANKSTTVKRLLSYFLKDIKILNVEAVRASGVKSKNDYSKYSVKLFFEIEKKSYLDFSPPIQICFFKKKSLNLREYRIIFPVKYDKNYVV